MQKPTPDHLRSNGDFTFPSQQEEEQARKTRLHQVIFFIIRPVTHEESQGASDGLGSPGSASSGLELGEIAAAGHASSEIRVLVGKVAAAVIPDDAGRPQKHMRTNHPTVGIIGNRLSKNKKASRVSYLRGNYQWSG